MGSLRKVYMVGDPLCPFCHSFNQIIVQSSIYLNQTYSNMLNNPETLSGNRRIMVDVDGENIKIDFYAKATATGIAQTVAEGSLRGMRAGNAAGGG
jgi:hypothetical protein